jgi:hypothetical protein
LGDEKRFEAHAKEMIVERDFHLHVRRGGVRRNSGGFGFEPRVQKYALRSLPTPAPARGANG